MASPVTIMSDQKLAIGITILDKGGEPYATIPSGYTVLFESSDQSVVGLVVRPDGLNADLSSDNVGVSTINVSAQKPDGTHLNGSPDSVEVTVINAEANSMNLTVGAPEPE